MTAVVDSFTYPEHLDDAGIDQVVDLAARGYVAVDSEQGAIIVDPCDAASVVLRMITSMWLFGDIGRVVIVCKPEHTLFWEEKVDTRTPLKSMSYSGSQRHDRLPLFPQAQVLVSTSETLCNDLLVKDQHPGKRSTGVWRRGAYFSAFDVPGTLWVFADINPLLSRGTETHRAWAAALDLMEHPRVVAVQRELPAGEGLYNLGRLVVPKRMPSVAEFEHRYCRGRKTIPARIDGVDRLFGPALICAADLREDF